MISIGFGIGLIGGAPGVDAAAILDEDGNPIRDEENNAILTEE